MGVDFDFAAVLNEWPLLAKGVLWTLALSSVAALLGVALGIACAWARTRGPRWSRWVVGVYVELIRNTPFIIQLFFLFFGLPALGLRLSPTTSSIVAMVLNLGAYSAEIVRAGVDTTPKGQIEAAQSLALSPLQVYLHVILPPALQRIWPALVGQIIIVMLGSSVCGQISTEELSYAANLIQSRNFRAFEAFIIAALIYLALSFFVRAVLRRVGQLPLFGGRRG
jgi:polar amino acid transport system permease protein